MPNLYSRIFARIVVIQAGRRPEVDYLKETGAGNILDLSTRLVLSTELGGESAERVATTDGTSIPVSRSHVAEIPIIGEEVGRLAELMNRIGCYCQFIALGLPGTKHLRWSEPSRMTVEDRTNGPLQFAPKVLRLESSVFHPNIVQSHNIVEQVPFENTDTRALNKRNIDSFEVEEGTDNIYAFQNNDGLFYTYDSFTFGSFQRPNAVTFYDEDLPYQEAGGKGGGIITVASNSVVGELDKSSGAFTEYFSPSVTIQGIARIAPTNGTRPENLIYWVPGSNEFWEVDESDNVQQKWTVSEFSQVTKVTYDFNGASDERGILALDSGGTVYSLSLAPNSDSYTVTDTYTPNQPFAVSSKTGWEYFAIVEAIEGPNSTLANTIIRAPSVHRYDQTDGSLVDETELQDLVLRQRGVGERKGYEGERFDVPEDGVTVDLSGQISGLSSGNTLTLELIYPVPFTTLKFENATVQIDVLAWGGTVLSSTGTNTDPTLTIDDPATWKLVINVSDSSGPFKIGVTAPGHNRALGARKGSWVSDCLERASSVLWTTDSGGGDTSGTVITTETGESITTESGTVIDTEN